MPNWCYNYLTITGEEKDISAIKAQLNKPFQQKHHQWNSNTGNMELTDTLYPNPVFAFHNIYNYTQDGISEDEYITQPDRPRDHSDTDKLMSTIADEMANSNFWYDWNVRNWGTKWDVGVSWDNEYPDTELTDESDSMLGYRFNTAWSPPIPAMTKLSEQYPDVEIELSYEEETGWGGTLLFSQGQFTELEDYENKCRDCDALNTMEYCDNDCGEICSECHYLGEADMDCVAKCEVHREFATIN